MFLRSMNYEEHGGVATCMMGVAECRDNTHFIFK